MRATTSSDASVPGSGGGSRHVSMDRDLVTTRSMMGDSGPVVTSSGGVPSSGATDSHPSRGSKRFIFPTKMKGFSLKRIFKGSNNKQGRKTSKRPPVGGIGAEDDVDMDHSQFEDSPRSAIGDVLSGGRSPSMENRGPRPTLNDILPTPTEKALAPPTPGQTTTPSASTSGTIGAESLRVDDGGHTPKRASSGGRQAFAIPDDQSLRFEQVKCEMNDGYSSDGSRTSILFCNNEECGSERKKLRKHIEDLRSRVSARLQTCKSHVYI